jgi:hypothetical protein
MIDDVRAESSFIEESSNNNCAKLPGEQAAERGGTQV